MVYVRLQICWDKEQLAPSKRKRVNEQFKDYVWNSDDNGLMYTMPVTTTYVPQCM